MKHGPLYRVSLVVAITLGLAGKQYAQTFTPLAPAKGFNVFASGNLTAGAGDTHGPVACGGDMILNGSTIFTMNTSGTYPTGTLNDPANYGMVIGGKVQYISGNTTQVNQGYLRIGNTTGSTLWYTDNNSAVSNLKLTADGQPYSTSLAIQTTKVHPDGSATDPHGINFFAASVTLSVNSGIINDMGTNVACSSQVNKITIPAGSNPHITLVDNKVNYISLSSDQLTDLNSQGSIIFDNSPAANRLVIFNITPSFGSLNYSWTTPNFGGVSEPDGDFMLWNFFGFSSIGIAGGNSVYGTILAPTANITKTGGNNTNGQVIGASVALNYGEVHYHPFTATLPLCPTGGPLPVKEINLAATLQNNNVNLQWSVTGEENISNYRLEKSTDGNNFYPIATVSATGRPTYAAVDQQFLTQVAYYRVVAVEITGKLYYSRAVAVRAATKGKIQTWPNPVSDELHIAYNSTVTGKLDIQLLNATGETVLRKTFSALAGSNQFDITGLRCIAPGMYVIRINNELTGEGLTQKIIKR